MSRELRLLVKHCALSRYGLDVGKQARRILIRRVWKGDVKYARKLTSSRTVIVLDHDGGELVFIYSSANKEIIRFLAPDAPETAEWRRSLSAPPPNSGVFVSTEKDNLEVRAGREFHFAIAPANNGQTNLPGGQM